MIRLTVRSERSDVILAKVGDVRCEDFCGDDLGCKDCAIQEAFDKLAHYEDLEEQGRLQKLLCKPGDRVWCIEEDDYVGCLFMGMCGEYAIVCSTYTWCEDFDHHLETMAEETIEDGDTHVEIFHKSNVFLDKAEAKAKILELRGEEE